MGILIASPTAIAPTRSRRHDPRPRLLRSGQRLAGQPPHAVDGQIPPPPEYDHPYGGKVVIEQYHTVASLREACGVSTAVGCMLREDGTASLPAWTIESSPGTNGLRPGLTP